MFNFKNELRNTSKIEIPTKKDPKYKLFCKSRGFEFVENSIKFGVRLKRLAIKGVTKSATKTGCFYTFDIDELKETFKMNDLSGGNITDSDSDCEDWDHLSLCKFLY